MTASLNFPSFDDVLQALYAGEVGEAIASLSEGIELQFTTSFH